MIKFLLKYFFFTMFPLSMLSQNRLVDSTRLENRILIGVNNSFSFASVKDFTNTNGGNYNQFEVTLMPKLGYFVGNNLAIGLQWKYGWYWSNFDRTLPNTSSKGIFFEYYFTKWKSYKLNTLKRKNKTFGYLHPFVNVSYNLNNYYNGKDSLNLAGAIFNGRSDNQSLKTLIGVNWNTLRKVNINFSIGIETSRMPNVILNNTRVIRALPVSELGIAMYLKKQKKK